MKFLSILSALTLVIALSPFEVQAEKKSLNFKGPKNSYTIIVDNCSADCIKQIESGAPNTYEIIAQKCSKKGCQGLDIGLPACVATDCQITVVEEKVGK